MNKYNMKYKITLKPKTWRKIESGCNCIGATDSGRHSMSLAIGYEN